MLTLPNINRILGSDASPVVLPLRGAGKEFHRTLPHLPQTANVQSASKARLILSWWGNEIRIWELLNPAKELLSEAAIGADIRKNRRLIAQLVVKGESNITSAAISEDGTLIVVSTVSEVKAFQLDYRRGPSAAQPQLKKLDITTSGNGATKVEISPDANWLCWVEEGSKITVARINTTGGTHEITQPYKVKRLPREISKNLLLGGLGSYDRNVTQVTFSPDSKMLAVADLAGYIDTWVLLGPGEQSNGAIKQDEEELSSSDESSDEEDEQTEGERWTRNPKAALIPKLASAPAVLSFSKTSLPDGQGDDDYLLLAITTLNQVLLFNPLHGSLADWSRRNTYAKLPEPLRVTRDLVKGAVWQGPRVWIYGISFLFMLDLSQDMDAESAVEQKNGRKLGNKRKRDNESGAGGKMDKHTLAPHSIKTAVGPPEGVEWVDVEMVDADDSKSVGASSGFEDDDDDEDDETDGGELQRLRESGEGGGNGEDSAALEKAASSGPAKWWHTYQYRPILGIVPLQNTDQQDGASEEGFPPLEVALVERPSWEADLPPRYFADDERER